MERIRIINETPAPRRPDPALTFVRGQPKAVFSAMAMLGGMFKKQNISEKEAEIIGRVIIDQLALGINSPVRLATTMRINHLNATHLAYPSEVARDYPN